MTYLDNKPTLFKSPKDVPMPWPYKNFKPEEFASNGNGEVLVVPSFMDKLQLLRDKYGRPMLISSGYRDPAYNSRVSSTGTKGPHTTGRAVDVQVFGKKAFALIALAGALGFTGCGVAQKGSHRARFIHLDDLMPEDGHSIRPWIWSY